MKRTASPVDTKTPVKKKAKPLSRPNDAATDQSVVSQLVEKQIACGMFSKPRDLPLPDRDLLKTMQKQLEDADELNKDLEKKLTEARNQESKLIKAVQEEKQKTLALEAQVTALEVETHLSALEADSKLSALQKRNDQLEQKLSAIHKLLVEPSD